MYKMLLHINGVSIHQCMSVGLFTALIKWVLQVKPIYHIIKSNYDHSCDYCVSIYLLLRKPLERIIKTVYFRRGKCIDVFVGQGLIAEKILDSRNY